MTKPTPGQMWNARADVLFSLAMAVMMMIVVWGVYLDGAGPVAVRVMTIVGLPFQLMALGFWIRWVRLLKMKRKNLVVVIGDTRAGMSYASLQIAGLLDAKIKKQS